MSRFKFLGSKGQMVKPDVYVVDKAINPKLHAEVLADTEPIPEGSIVVLVDGATSEAKLAVKQTPWSEGLGLGSGGAGGTVEWDDITGKPTTFAPVIGTTATTAMAGNTTIPAASTTAPAALATAAAVGTGTTFARADHVHARPTGAQVLATGYVIGAAGAVAAADTINAAIGKLEARIVALETP